MQVNRIQRWYRPGLLLIGDAAHAISPVGGVGINLAIQDAVAAANLLTSPLLHGRPSEADLAAVQKRREFPARMTQSVQAGLHRLMVRALRNPGPLRVPVTLKIALRTFGIHRLLGRAVGIGIRPEHVKIGAVRAPAEVKPRKWDIAVAAAAGLAVAMLTVRLLHSNCTFTNAWSRNSSARKRSFTGWR